MANLPTVCIVTNAKKDDVNAVFAAWGRGPETFTRKLCGANPNATYETQPTHWLMNDQSMTDSDVAIMQAFANADLPPTAQGVVWGENGAIPAAAAMAAIAGAHLQIYSASGDVVPTEHVAGILNGRGLQYVPDPPL